MVAIARYSITVDKQGFWDAFENDNVRRGCFLPNNLPLPARIIVERQDGPRNHGDGILPDWMTKLTPHCQLREGP